VLRPASDLVPCTDTYSDWAKAYFSFVASTRQNSPHGFIDEVKALAAKEAPLTKEEEERAKEISESIRAIADNVRNKQEFERFAEPGETTAIIPSSKCLKRIVWPTL